MLKSSIFSINFYADFLSSLQISDYHHLHIEYGSHVCSKALKLLNVNCIFRKLQNHNDTSILSGIMSLCCMHILRGCFMYKSKASSEDVHATKGHNSQRDIIPEKMEISL